jgi:hypothetical protein
VSQIEVAPLPKPPELAREAKPFEDRLVLSATVGPPLLTCSSDRKRFMVLHVKTLSNAMRVGTAEKGLGHAELAAVGVEHQGVLIVKAAPTALDLGDGRFSRAGHFLSRWSSPQLGEQSVRQVPELEVALIHRPDEVSTPPSA